MDMNCVENEKMNDEELRKVNGGAGSPNDMFSGVTGSGKAPRKKCTNPNCPRCGIVFETNNGTCEGCGKFLSVVI